MIMTQKQKAALVREYRTLKTYESKLKEVTDKLKALAQEEGGEFEAGGFKVSVTPVNRSTLDSGAIKQEMPNVYAKYTRVSSYNRLNVK